MKKLICLSLFLTISIAVFSQNDAQTYNYVKTFETNKQQYIGQPFSTLLNDMTEVQPKSAWAITHGRFKYKVVGTHFHFDIPAYAIRRDAVVLSIRWQEIIPREDTKYYEQRNNFNFTAEERAFYGTKIIKDILVYQTD